MDNVPAVPIVEHGAPQSNTSNLNSAVDDVSIATDSDAFITPRSTVVETTRGTLSDVQVEREEMEFGEFDDECKNSSFDMISDDVDNNDNISDDQIENMNNLANVDAKPSTEIAVDSRQIDDLFRYKQTGDDMCKWSTASTCSNDTIAQQRVFMNESTMVELADVENRGVTGAEDPSQDNDLVNHSDLNHPSDLPSPDTVAVPHEIVPVSQETVPQETVVVPQETVTEEAMSPETVPPETVSQQEFPQEELAEEAVPVPQETVPQETVTQETVPVTQETVPVPQETVPQETVTQETVTQETVTQETVPVPQETVVVPQETVPQETVVVPQETVTEGAMSEEKVSQETVPKQEVPQEILSLAEEAEPVPHEIVPQETVTQKTTPEETLQLAEESVAEEVVTEGSKELADSHSEASDDWIDVLGSGALKKRTKKAGTGPNLEKGQQVRMKFTLMLSSGKIVDDNVEQTFQLGDGEVIDAIDLTANLAKVGEVYEAMAQSRFAYGILGRPPHIGPNSSVLMVIEIIQTEATPTVLDQSERVKIGDRKRKIGNEHFARHDYARASTNYTSACKYLDPPSYELDCEVSAEIKDIQAKTWCNLALSELKSGNSERGIVAINRALQIQPNSTKALYRKGKLLEERGELEEAERVLKKALEIDSTSVGCKQYLKELSQKLASQKKKQQRLYKKMLNLEEEDEGKRELQAESKMSWLEGAIPTIAGSVTVGALAVAAYYGIKSLHVS